MADGLSGEADFLHDIAAFLPEEAKGLCRSHTALEPEYITQLWTLEGNRASDLQHRCALFDQVSQGEFLKL